MVEQLCARADIVCLQEVRGIAADVRYLPDSHDYHSTFFEADLDAYSSGRGGVVVGVRRSFSRRLRCVRTSEVWRGRALQVRFESHSGEVLVVIAVHLDPALSQAQQRRFLQVVRSFVDEENGAAAILIGDWNFLGRDDARLVDGVVEQASRDRIADFFEAAFQDFSEHSQPLPTFGKRGESGLSITSRLDRIYTNISEFDRGGIFCSLNVIGSLLHPHRPSDHLPIVYKVSLRRARSSRKFRLCTELLRSGVFAEVLGDMAEGMGGAGEPYEVVEASVEVAHRAARRSHGVLAAGALNQPRLLADQVLRVYHLARARMTKRAAEVAAATPRIARIWRDGEVAPQELLAAYRAWMEEALLLETAELERRCMPELDRRARRSQLRRQHTRIRARRRRQAVASWYTDEGEPLQTPAEIGAALQAYWGAIFNVRPDDEADMDEFLTFVVDVSDLPDWEWERGRTKELASVVRDSAPGPDGLPYSFWAMAPDPMHAALDDCAEQLQSGGTLRSPLSDSVSVTIPKAEVSAEAELVPCTARTVRPITLMQTSAKLLALRANEALAAIAARSVAMQQQGFVPGRSIDDCIVGLDGAMTAASLQAGESAMTILFDFANAFPSLAHAYLFRLLRKMRVLERLVCFVEGMYKNMSTTFEVDGVPVATMPICSGIRQGCPMSGSLFAIALDPLIRWSIANQFLSSARIFAYADDLAAVFRNVFMQIPVFMSALGRWAGVSGLALKPRKCVAIPLWEGPHDAAQDLLEAHGLPGIRVAKAARYLGVEVGPQASQTQWGGVAVRLLERARDILASGATLPTRVQLFNIHCGGLVRYRARFARPSAELHRAYRRAGQLITASPWQSLPADVLQGLDALHLPGTMVDLASLCTAARWASLSGTRALQTAWEEFDAAALEDGAALVAMADAPGRRPWHLHSSITAMFRQEHAECMRTRAAAEGCLTQSVLLRELRPDAETRRERLVQVLRRRALRWEPDAPEALVGAMFSFATGRPPLELISTALRTLCYAWCTNNRFGAEPHGCRLGCGREAGDAQQHYLVCPVARAFAARHLHAPVLPEGPGATAAAIRSLALAGSPGVRTAMWLDAVVCAVDSARHGARLAPTSVMIARVKELVRRHNVCRRAVLQPG